MRVLRPETSKSPAGSRERERKLGALSHISGLGTFLALCDLEFHLVPFLQTFITFRHDSTVVHKYIRPFLPPDKSVAFSVVEPLHCAFHTLPLTGLRTGTRRVTIRVC